MAASDSDGASQKRTSIVIAVIGALVSISVSIGTGWWSYHVNMVTQARQAQSDRIDKFASNPELMEAGALFFSSLNSARDLAPAKEKFASAIGLQVVLTNDLKPTAGSQAKKLVSDYQTALLELGRTVQKTNQVTEVRPFAEAFARVIDTRNALAIQLKSDLS